MTNHSKHDSWRVLNPSASKPSKRITDALFDFDGTISVLRRGWEEVMTSVMEESIGGGMLVSAEIRQEIAHYIDSSTGLLTIRQMEWLAQAVRRYGLVVDPLTAPQYKAIYLKKLMVRVNNRIQKLSNGASLEENMICGVRDFLLGLQQRHVRLFLASGTDHSYVVHEAQILNVDHFFNGGIFGALDDNEVNDKGKVIQRILDSNRLTGAQLLVVGDGPVEIREAKTRGAVTIGVASDEVHRCGWNERKTQRLSSVGADILASDFTQSGFLLDYLFLEN